MRTIFVVAVLLWAALTVANAANRTDLHSVSAKLAEGGAHALPGAKPK